MSSKKKESLADNIAQVLTAVPTTFDEVDNEADLLNANQIDCNTVDEYNEQQEQILSAFRKKNVDLLGDIDEKYAGKKTSRKNLRDEDCDGSDDENYEDLDSSEDTVAEELSESNSDEEEDEDNDDDETSIGEEEDLDDGSLLESDPEDATNFKHMKNENASAQMKKAQCVRNQMSIWETLLETRIQMQKCLVAANKMPIKPNCALLKQDFGSEYTNPLFQTTQNVTNVLEKLSTLQSMLLKKYPETKTLDTAKNKTENDNDEEIPSDTDVEEEELDDEEENQQKPEKQGKKRKLQDIEKGIDDQFKKYKSYRDGVIQKWNDKTRIVSKLNSTSHTVLNQINFALSNKEKLVRKTQLKRAQYRILLEKEEDDGDADGNKTKEEYNTEIFDDGDFYHQLLRELIEFKSSDITDPVQLGRQWIQLQNLRSKMKRKVDTKATKGRKIRYAVHNKLVNFMAPMDENKWTEEAKNELYNSLFEQRQIVS